MMIASGSIHAVVNAIVKGRPSPPTDTPPTRARPANDGPADDQPVLGSIMAARAMTDGASAVILLPAILLVPLPAGAWGWLAASAAVHVVYLYTMIRAYAAADFSAAYPAMRGVAPLVTAAVSVGLFGEQVRPLALAGIALIGAALLALVIGRHLGRAALGWSLVTGAMTALYTVVDAHGVRASPTVPSYIVWDFVLIGSQSVVIFALLTRGRVFAGMRAQWRPGTIAGGLSIVTYGLALTALSLGPTAPLAALRETGMVTALVLAVVFLREAVTARRVGAVAGIFAGAALILLA